MRPLLSPAPGLLSDGLLAFGFANPWLLWGLALGAIPIVIHLLHRRAYRETDWAAMRFLLEAARKNSRRLRLEQLVLLAVRSLVLLLAALAFAEPLVQAVAPRTRTRSPIQRVIVIDTSFSMGERGEAETRFERAKRLARQIAAASLPGDAVNVLRIADRAPPAIVREPAFETEPVLAEIDRLELTDEPGDLHPALVETANVLADPRAPATKEVVFISDFQRSTWGADASPSAETARPPAEPAPAAMSSGPAERPDVRAHAASARAGLHELFLRIADRARIVLVNVGDGRTENAAVTSLAAAEPIPLAGRPTRLRAGLRNFGGTNLPAARVELYVDGYLATVKSADLAARGETVVEFQHAFHDPGEHVVEVRLPADRLLADNQRWLSVPVAERMNVLVVNGREGGRPADNASHYVRTVLAPSTFRESWSGATQPKVISEADLAAEDLSRVDCVFLCNVALVTPTEAKLLEAYAAGGGGIVLALGDRVSTENYNALLYHDGKGLLPAALGEHVGDARDSARGGYYFDAGDLSHPILAPFRGNPRAGLERPVTLEYVKTRLSAGSPARVVLRFNSGDPAIVERQFGRGRVVLLTTSADVAWSTWPIHPTFPPIVHETVRYAAQGRWHDRQRLVGEPLTRTLGLRDSTANVLVKCPDGSERTVRPVLSEAKGEIVFSETDRRGIYEIVLGPPGGSKDQPSKEPAAKEGRELYAVNVDTRESDLETIDEQGLHSTTLAGVPYVHRSDWSDPPHDTDAAAEPSGISTWLLAAALGLLLVEPLLAWSFRHGLALLCALGTAGVGIVLFPHRRSEGLIVGIMLAAAIFAVYLFWPSPRVSEAAAGERGWARKLGWSSRASGWFAARSKQKSIRGARSKGSSDGPR